MSKKKLEEKYGKDTAKAIGTVLGLTKKDYTGQNVPRSKRAKDNLIDFGQTAAASSTLMGGVGPKSLIVPTSILASKVIGARRAIKQHEKLMAQRSKEKKEMSNTVAEAIDHIINKNYDAANNLLEEQITTVLKSKLHEMKKIVAAHQFNEAVVWPDGKVHTATGEMILPSIWRHRRGLSESMKLSFTDTSPKEDDTAPYVEPRFQKQHAQAEKGESEIGDLRKKEWDKGIRDAQRPAVEYKEERTKILDGISKAVLEKHPNVLSDPRHMENAKKEFHAAIMKDYSNHPIAQYYGHSHEFEGLHPAVQGDIERNIKSAAHHAERMKDPKYAELHNKAVETGKRNLEAIKASREAEKAAHRAFAKQQMDVKAKESKPGPEGWSKKLGDEIKF